LTTYLRAQQLAIVHCFQPPTLLPHSRLWVPNLDGTLRVTASFFPIAELWARKSGKTVFAGADVGEVIGFRFRSFKPDRLLGKEALPASEWR
ncbi:MAG: hypothetical protein NTZ15_20330, partial [Burkholderiales bacterium]|nr:hypothetical protein [Burkholderiales bacterium]